jgi:ubiquinone/menaquinone biosynthesis C-methylase UbiE
VHDSATDDVTEDRTDPERFDPAEDGGRLVDAEHRARYLIGASLAKGRRVLDAACGTGYGTAMLLEANPSELIALDIAPEALESTRRRVGDRAEVVRGDLRALPFEDDSFDLVVCLEAIEHVDDREGVLDELQRVTSPGGLLVLSSPNRDVYPPGNPHHIEEYTPDELADALGARFRNVDLLRQHPWLASAIETDHSEAPAVARLAELAPGGETYTVAIAGNEPIPPVHGQVVLADAFEVRWWHKHLDEATVRAEEAELAARLDPRILDAERRAASAGHAETEVRALLAEAGGRLLDLEAQLVDATDLRRRYDEVVAERARYEREVEAVFAEKDAALAAVVSSLSWRLTRPLRALKRLLG